MSRKGFRVLREKSEKGIGQKRNYQYLRKNTRTWKLCAFGTARSLERGGQALVCLAVPPADDVESPSKKRAGEVSKSLEHSLQPDTSELWLKSQMQI